MTALGHEERFPQTRMSAGCEFRKETIVGTRHNGRDAPIPAIDRVASARDTVSEGEAALSADDDGRKRPA
jgi:hypothetical protein